MEKESAEPPLLTRIKELGVSLGVKKFFDNLDLSRHNVCRHFMQFMVDFLHRDYKVQDEDVDNIDETLVCRVFNSDITDNFPRINCKQVVEIFLEYAFEFDRCLSVLQTCQEFTNAFLKHDGIPDDDIILGRCFMLLSFLLQPLPEFYRYTLYDPFEPNLDVSDSQIELNESIPKILEYITEVVIGGAEFKEYNSAITNEFIKAVEKNPDRYINKIGALSKYILLLQIDNNYVLTQTIKSLFRLCEFLSVKNELKKFFFNAKYQVKDENGENVKASVKDILVQLAIERGEINLSTEILELFNQIIRIDNEFMAKEERLEIYKRKIRMDNEKVRQSLLRMMTKYDGCVFVPLVEVFNEINASIKFVEKAIIHCDQHVIGIKLQGIADIIVENIDNSTFCIRACQVFNCVNQHLLVPDELPFLHRIKGYLSCCVDDEFCFGTFVDFMINISPTLLSTTLQRRENMRIDLLTLLTSSLIKFSYPEVVFKIITLLKIIKSFNINFVKHHLKALMTKFYEEMIEIDAAEIAGLECDKNFKNSLMKLNIVYEIEIFSYVDYFEYDAILIINRKHIYNVDDENFLYFARFQATLLKFCFIFLLNKIQKDLKAIFPITIEQTVQCAYELRERLIAFAMEAEKLHTYYDTMMLITSIFDLHCAITTRPILIENSTKILSVPQPKMANALFRKLANLLEDNMNSNCEIGTAPKDHFKYNDPKFIVKLIDSFTIFLKSYNHPLNITQVFKIVSHYSEPEFERSIHSLLKFLQFKKEFPQILGFCIMNFALKKKNESYFAIFAHAINIFLVNEDRENIKIEVAEFVLNSLPAFMKKIETHDNRMKILKFMTIFMKKYSSKDEAKKISNLATKVTSELILKKSEALAVETFIKSVVYDKI